MNLDAYDDMMGLDFGDYEGLMGLLDPEMLKEAAAVSPQARIKINHEPKFWNNARLNTVATYYNMVPGFERLLKEKGGDLEAFHREVSSMRKLSNEERMKILGTSANHD